VIRGETDLETVGEVRIGSFRHAGIRNQEVDRAIQALRELNDRVKISKLKAADLDLSTSHRSNTLRRHLA